MNNEEEPIQQPPTRRAAPARIEREDTIKRHSEALKTATALLGAIDDNLEEFEAFNLILRRNRGAATPVEEFIANLVRTYIFHDDYGEGLTFEAIAEDLEEVRTNLSAAVTEAHFVADRYPRPPFNRTVKKGSG